MNSDEKKFCEKRVKDLTADIDDATYQLAYIELMLNQGLRVNYAKKEKEFREQKKEYEQLLKISNETVTILKEQISKGVEVKKIVEVKDGKTDTNGKEDNKTWEKMIM